LSDTLLLNADAQPVSLLPLSLISWQESIRYMVLEKARVLFWHEDWIVRSASWETNVPAVLILKDYQKNKSYVRMSKKNVYLRDEHTCQYCGTHCDTKNRTVDHVLPLCRGGKSTWLNLVTACKKCNSIKGAETRMKPTRPPYRPDYYDLAEKRRRQGFDYRHPSWHTFLSKNS